MTIRTVVIPKRFLTSIPIVFVLTIVVISLIHLFGTWEGIAAEADWSAPENKGAAFIPVRLIGFWNNCGMRDDSHYSSLDKPTIEWEKYESKINLFKISASFLNTFRGHWIAIILSTLLGTPVIYFSRRLRFKTEL